jgi:hypothetical protein
MFWSKVRIACVCTLLLGSAVVFVGVANESNVQQRSSMLLASDKATTSEMWRLYDPDPNHVWNRLYRNLYRREGRDSREYGYDELDPLLWWSTKYLLKTPAYQQVTTVLDEFLSAHAEKMIGDPLKRAILQRDLWAIFDWTTTVLNNSQEKLNLQIKLVQVINRLALSPDQIAALPDTYKQATSSRAFAVGYDPNNREQPFLPPDLFDRKGPWVQLSARGGEPVALTHVGFFSGRSVFLVFMRFPEGREATLKYLKTLSDFPKPWLPDPEEPRRLLPNSDLPEFPAGTQLALVREMVLIDSQGNLRPTNIIEDIQFRVHHTIPSEIPALLHIDRNKAGDAMDVYEFKLRRSKLFASENGGLQSMTKGDTEFPLFMSQGIDLFEETSPGFSLERGLRVSLRACASCHFRPGVHSMLSRRSDSEILMSWDENYESGEATGWKGRQYNWGLLQGLWNSQPNASK